MTTTVEVAAEITLAAQALGINPDGLDDVSVLRAIQAEGKRLALVNAVLLAACLTERSEVSADQIRASLLPHVQAHLRGPHVQEHLRGRLARMDEAISLAQDRERFTQMDVAIALAQEGGTTP